jgi:hypothetical protein
MFIILLEKFNQKEVLDMGTTEFLSDQLTALSGSLGGEDTPSIWSRFIGGTNRANQPFISGYHQIWVQFPDKLFNAAAETALKWMCSTCEGFTPHSTTMNFVDVNGIGQIGSSFPSSRTVNREFTLTFREYRSLPIMNIFRTWHALFDTHAGISTLKAVELIPRNYKGAIMVAILKPTASGSNATLTKEDVEEIYFYEGVFPSTIPEDTATAADQASNETIQESVTFKFDGAPLDKSYNNGAIVESFINKVSGNSYNSAYNHIGLTTD